MIRERFESEYVLEISEYQGGRKGWWWAFQILHIIINGIHFYQWRMIASRDYIIYANKTRISFSYIFYAFTLYFFIVHI